MLTIHDQPGCAAVTVTQVRSSVDRIIAEEAAAARCDSFTVVDVPPQLAGLKLGMPLCRTNQAKLRICTLRQASKETSKH